VSTYEWENRKYTQLKEANAFDSKTSGGDYSRGQWWGREDILCFRDYTIKGTQELKDESNLIRYEMKNIKESLKKDILTLDDPNESFFLSLLQEHKSSILNFFKLFVLLILFKLEYDYLTYFQISENILKFALLANINLLLKLCHLDLGINNIFSIKIQEFEVGLNIATNTFLLGYFLFNLIAHDENRNTNYALALIMAVKLAIEKHFLDSRRT